MRYTRQHNMYGCGPIALLNALKWAGYQVSRKEYFKELCEIMNCDSVGLDSGTDPLDLNYGLAARDELRIKNIFHVPRLKEIDKEIDAGRAVILSYLHKEGGGHYSLIIGRTKKYYIVVNDHREKTVMKRSRKTMFKMVRENRVYPGTHRFSVAWSIEAR